MQALANRLQVYPVFARCTSFLSQHYSSVASLTHNYSPRAIGADLVTLLSHPHGSWQARAQGGYGFATTAHSSAPTVNYSNDSQDALVNSLVQQGLLTRGGRVEGVMRAVDRRDFTSTHLGIPPHISYMDGQVPIGQGQSISAPSLHAVMLELVAGHAKEGAVVMDVGTGSGYLAACLSLLVGLPGRVVAVERQERLLQQARVSLVQSLSPHHARHVPHGGEQRRDTAVHNVTLVHGNILEEPVLEAVAGEGLYDAVVVGAAARSVPQGLVELLRPGGRLVVAVGRPLQLQELLVVDKGADGRVASSKARDVQLPPLAPAMADRFQL